MKGTLPAVATAFASALLFLSLEHAVAAQDPCLSLGSPVLTNNQILLSLSCESGVTYYIESSTDLQNWTRILTNIDPGFSRIVTTDVPGQTTFYRASRGRLPLFGAGIATSQNIDMKGNGITVDSYDSSDPSHSTNGMYTAATRMAGGDIFSSGNLVNVGNAAIYGHLRLAPGGSYSLGPNGSVGDLAWSGPGAEPGWVTNDYRFCLPNVAPPYTSGVPLPAPVGAIIPLASANYYVAGNYLMRNGDVLMVDGGAARLYITGALSMSVGSAVVITNGGTLRLYLGSPNGPSASSVFTAVAMTGNSSTFQVYCLPTITNLTWSGNTNFVGTVYAPQASFSLGAGGAFALDYQGAVAVASLTLNGHFNFHFDEYLKRSSMTR